MRMLGVVLGIVLGAGCGGEESMEGWGERGGASFAVWARDREERATTYFLDRSGREVSRADGIVLWSPLGELTWREERVPVPTVPCEMLDDRIHPPSEGWETRVTLVPRAGPPIAVAPHSVDAAEASWLNEYQSSLRLLASAGTLLFLLREEYAYGCGVHGNTTGSTFVWDIAAQGPADLQGELSAMDLEQAFAAAPEKLAEERDGYIIDGAPGREELRLTGVVPRFEPDGLRVHYQITADTCYACSRGNAGSYTRSDLLEGYVLPLSLAPHAQLPDAVASFARQHPELSIGGFGGHGR